MTPLIRQRSSHWYYPGSLEPCHQVPRAKGGGTRDTTLADARKHGLWPSVTNVLGVLAKPGLEAWKLEQAILASLTLPRIDNEPVDVYARRIVTDMDAQVEKAADLGTAVHAYINEYVTGKEPSSQGIEAYLPKIVAWVQAEILEVVKAEAIVGRMGVAGRLDLIAKTKSHGPAVIDFKTKKFKGGKPNFYDEWGWQLGAYATLAGDPHQAKISVAINTDPEDAGAVAVKVWEGDQWQPFWHCWQLWQIIKGYCPK